jgi:hypothetical protein
MPQLENSTLQNCFIYQFLLIFETGSCCVAQAGLKLLGSKVTLLSGWDYTQLRIIKSIVLGICET